MTLSTSIKVAGCERVQERVNYAFMPRKKTGNLKNLGAYAVKKAKKIILRSRVVLRDLSTNKRAGARGRRNEGVY